MLCAVCQREIPLTRNKRARTCSKRCANSQFWNRKCSECKKKIPTSRRSNSVTCSEACGYLRERRLRKEATVQHRYHREHMDEVAPESKMLPRTLIEQWINAAARL